MEDPGSKYWRRYIATIADSGPNTSVGMASVRALTPSWARPRRPAAAHVPTIRLSLSYGTTPSCPAILLSWIGHEDSMVPLPSLSPSDRTIVPFPIVLGASNRPTRSDSHLQSGRAGAAPTASGGFTHGPSRQAEGCEPVPPPRHICESPAR